MNLIQKAADRIASLAARSGPRGVLSTFIPGIGHNWGQPNTVNAQAGDIYSQITLERMREIVLECPTAAGAMRSPRCSSEGCGAHPAPAGIPWHEPCTPLPSNSPPTQTSEKGHMSC